MLFIMERDNIGETDIEFPKRIIIEVEDGSHISGPVQGFRDFLAAVGFHKDTINEYVGEL